MRIHIGITTKNRASILPKAIESALNQSYIDKVISVFDDSSDDGTAELSKKYTDISWILSKEPKGLVYARNLFLHSHEAELFCSLDDDSWFIDNDALETAVKYLKADSSIAAIAFDIKDRLNPDMPATSIQAQEVNTFIGCGHLYRTGVVKKVGEYIPLPGYYGGEEKDLCIRLMNEGYKIVLLKGLYVWHDKTNVARNGYLQHRSGVCNDLVFAFRRTPFLLLIPSLLVKLWKHFYFSLSYPKEKLLKAYFEGCIDFFKYLFSGKLSRKAVSLNAFRKFLRLN